MSLCFFVSGYRFESIQPPEFHKPDDEERIKMVIDYVRHWPKMPVANVGGK